MSKKKELLEEDIDNQIVELLMKKGVKSAHDISTSLNQMYGKVVPIKFNQLETETTKITIRDFVNLVKRFKIMSYK